MFRISCVWKMLMISSQAYKQKHASRLHESITVVIAGREELWFTSCFHGWSSTASVYNTLEHDVAKITPKQYAQFMQEIHRAMLSGLAVEAV